jgi:hypothetical protein
MTLLGFKPKDFLQDYYCIKPSMFMIADEAMIAGSTAFLGKLIERLEKKDFIALCTLVVRKNSQLQFVALIPQSSPTMGFHVIPLPFCDDIRDIPAPPITEINESYLETMESIIEPLIAPFDPNQLENPSLAKQYAYLHAMALGLEDFNIVDQTIPDRDLIVQKSGQLIQQLNQMTAEEIPPPEVKVVKRKASEVDTIDETDVKLAIEKDSLKKYTVPQLTELIKAKGEKVKSKKKADLMDQIIEIYQ